MYRIAWMSLITGVLGHGEHILSSTASNEYVKILNERHDKKILHWREKKQ